MNFIVSYRLSRAVIFGPNKYYRACAITYYCPVPSLVCLQLNKGNTQPIICLKGLLEPCSLTPRYRSSQARGLLDPDCLKAFVPEASTLEILSNPACSSLQVINRLNQQDGQWHSSYRFFQRPVTKLAGRDILIDPKARHIVTFKEKGEGKEEGQLSDYLFSYDRTGQPMNKR